MQSNSTMPTSNQIKLYYLFIATVFFVAAFQNPGKTSRYVTKSSYFNEVPPTHGKSFRPLRLINNKLRLKMSMVEDSETPVATPVATPVDDFSKFAVGQEYEGSLISAKTFGVFVGISSGVNVLLPRSVLSKSAYEKLKRLTDAKSTDKVKFELIGVSAENKTLSGKYIPPGAQARDDISSLQGVNLASRIFNATVVSVHDFGIFAELDEFGVEGLVPASKLPEKMALDAMTSTFPVGSKIVVKIEELNIGNKKLVLSMRTARADVSAFSTVGADKWIQGIVQKVTDFGMFVRPAGFDTTGLLHRSQVPRDLVTALKKRVPPSKVANQTDVELLFSVGDVVKVRVQSVAVDTRRLELSMLPMRNRNEEEDDYVVEGRDPEGEEYKSFEDSDDEDENQYDAEDTLLWWRGARYVKTADLESNSASAVDEEAAVINESSSIVEGTWRRMFELDMREDAADFSSKVVEAELKELEEEIGELSGLDDDMLDATGFGYKPSSNVGSFISSSMLPAGLKEQMEFFKEMEASEGAVATRLKGGKKGEKEEFENLLKEAEAELLQSNSKRGGAAVEIPVAVAATPVESEVPVEALSVSEPAAAVEEAPSA